MKKLVTLTLSVVALAGFTGLSAAQEKKPMTPAAIPPADMVTLSATKSSVVVSQKGCSVTARPGNSANSSWIYPNYHSVNFEKWASNNWVAYGQPMVTNSQGITPPQNVPSNAKVRAWITKVNGQKAYSNDFTCSDKFQTE